MAAEAETGIFARIGRGITWARNFTINALFLLLVVFVLVALVRGCSGGGLLDQQALLIAPAGVLVENRSAQPSFAQLAAGDVASEVLVSDLVRAIEHATTDDRIPVIALQLEDLFGISQAAAHTIGAKLQAFQAAGKTVIAYGTAYTQGQYLLSSYADELYLHPMGSVLFTGYGSYPLYFKELLDKLNIDVEIFKVGEFKSAVEPFSETQMSEAAREANQAMVDALWQSYSALVAENRSMAPAAFADFVAQFDQQAVAARGDLALALIEGHLVDELLGLDEANARIGDRAGFDDDGRYSAVGLADYLTSLGPELPALGDSRIGLITLSGPIVMEGGEGSMIAANEARQLIRDARRDENVQALVLRVSSPGGSAFASEIIRKELELAQLAGKPVVVSMADVAASGGYWISATADRIVAHPSTITGSIGVFGVVASIDRALAEVGVHSDGVGTTPLSGGLSPAQGIPEEFSRIIQASIENTYTRFTGLVASGRDLPLDTVLKIAEGRVWMGAKAHELGLVDELGDLNRAIELAAELAELDDWQVQKFAPPVDPRALLLQELVSGQATAPGTTRLLLGQLQQAAKRLDAFDDPQRVYALCESCEFTLAQ